MIFAVDKAQLEKLAVWEKEQDELVVRSQLESDVPFIKQMAEEGIPYYGARGGMVGRS